MGKQCCVFCSRVVHMNKWTSLRSFTKEKANSITVTFFMRKKQPMCDIAASHVPHTLYWEPLLWLSGSACCCFFAYFYIPNSYSGEYNIIITENTVYCNKQVFSGTKLLTLRWRLVPITDSRPHSLTSDHHAAFVWIMSRLHLIPRRIQPFVTAGISLPDLLQ